MEQTSCLFILLYVNPFSKMIRLITNKIITKTFALNENMKIMHRRTHKKNTVCNKIRSLGEEYKKRDSANDLN